MDIPPSYIFESWIEVTITAVFTILVTFLMLHHMKSSSQNKKHPVPKEKLGQKESTERSDVDILNQTPVSTNKNEDTKKSLFLSDVETVEKTERIVGNSNDLNAKSCSYHHPPSYDESQKDYGVTHEDKKHRDCLECRTFPSEKTDLGVKEDNFIELQDLDNKAKLHEDVPGASRKETVVIKEYKSQSASEIFSFNLTKKGCNVTTPYCKLSFPPGAVVKPITINMKPNWNPSIGFDNKTPICPFVYFSSTDKLTFRKDVTVSLYTSYTCADQGKKISVQIARWENKDSPPKIVQVVSHGIERYISFTCRQFCGYSAVADQAQYVNMQRHYLFSGYTRKNQDNTTRIFHWMIYEDTPLTCEQTSTYLKDKDIVIDPQSFSVRYSFNLQLRVIDSNVEVQTNNQKVNLIDNWGKKFRGTKQFRLRNIQGNADPPQSIGYKVFAVNSQTQAVIEVAEEHFYLEWIAPTVTQQINVHDSGIGMQINTPITHQISVASSTGTDAGYQSDILPSSPSRMDSNPIRASIDEKAAVEEINSFVENQITSPKSSSLRPVAQSTPQHSPTFDRQDQPSSEKTFQDN